ncbi:helix-turn-helix transcriptional regulator [Schinkia azotoformans]|uniref:Phage regulatory protein n=1 Tax=Schinkia azotoformans LMG 9581 TaxID=1131731 RepID=K6D5I5_SCHAZ|nr:helix-turn-helix transcriptional regulator [Schinkia azotoformans]EKN63318.1 phage regulatory protein [Schinkia azotoformans LMG 9581]MEC1640400.1 helix-turn-helix transcriptional regulator [Schinkia azotoformans]MEC1946584.1 helix-turn-helix transcriptional regulator [Schinkia azotoformans]
MSNKKHIPFFGIIVKKRLIELNMTQRQLAKKIGVNENYLTDILNGRRSGKKYIDQLTKTLALDIDEK